MIIKTCQSGLQKCVQLRRLRDFFVEKGVRRCQVPGFWTFERGTVTLLHEHAFCKHTAGTHQRRQTSRAREKSSAECVHPVFPQPASIAPALG